MIDLENSSVKEGLFSRFVYLIVLLATGLTPLELLAQNIDIIKIAHRGASAERPEHTLAAYELAIDRGANFIEPDLVVTKDLRFIARHENELSETTDVASREEFENRRRDKIIDGQRVAGWFAEDFTLEEIRTLRARERFPNLRPSNVFFNNLFQVPTLHEIVSLVRAKEKETGRRIGLYPELKHPTFLLQEEGIDVVDLLLKDLQDLEVKPDQVFIQSFEVRVLQRLNERSDFKLVQLLNTEGGPADEPTMRYAEMATFSGLEDIKEYADIIGAAIPLILLADGSPTSLVQNAQSVGLLVHAWTLRPENAFLPLGLQSVGGPSEQGDYKGLYDLLVSAGVSGVFMDDLREIAAANVQQ